MRQSFIESVRRLTGSGDTRATQLVPNGVEPRSKLPDLIYQEIWAYLIVHHTISALIAAASAADLDPDRISFTKACA